MSTPNYNYPHPTNAPRHHLIRMARISTEDKDLLQKLHVIRGQIRDHRKLGARLELHPDVTMEQLQEATERRRHMYAVARDIWDLAKAKLVTRGIHLLDFNEAVLEPGEKLFIIRPIRTYENEA